MPETPVEIARRMLATGKLEDTSCLSRHAMTPEQIRAIDARRNPEAQQKVNVLWEQHEEILRRLALGQRNKQIALELGITPVAVSYVRNSDLGRARLAELQNNANAAVKEVTKRVKEMAPQVLDALEEMYQDESTPAAVRAKICFDLLDRAGTAAPSRHQVAHAVAYLPEESLQRIKERARQNGLVVDVDVEASPAARNSAESDSESLEDAAEL